MNIKNYISGEYRQEYQSKSFVPSMINHTFTWDEPQINTLLEDATRALGELNAFTMMVPNNSTKVKNDYLVIEQKIRKDKFGNINGYGIVTMPK